MTTKVNCPTCSHPVTWDKSSEFRPFCSKRCQLIDLGDWAEGSNRIAQEKEMSALTEADLDNIDQLLAQQESQFFKD